MKTYFRLVLTSALLGVCAFGATGCEGHSCSIVNARCLDSVHVYITAESWRTGDYTVGLTTPERAFTCSLPVPVLESEGSAGAAGQTGGWGSLAECTQTAGPAADQAEFPSIAFDHGVSIYLYGAPDEVLVTLHYQSQILLEERVIPSYTKSYLNGPECGPACLYSEATIEARSPTAS